MEVHFRHFVAYESRLPELNHLRKLTSGLWFTFQALILRDLYSNHLNDTYTYKCMTNMVATTQQMKNYKGI